MLLVFGRGVFKLAWFDRQHVEWLSDSHSSNFGTDLLREEDALLDGLVGEIRPVSR